MSDKSQQAGGWSKEQTAYNLFEKVLYIYDDQVPKDIDSALVLYAKCMSVVQYGSNGNLGQKIADMND